MVGKMIVNPGVEVPLRTHSFTPLDSTVSWSAFVAIVSPLLCSLLPVTP